MVGTSIIISKAMFRKISLLIVSLGIAISTQAQSQVKLIWDASVGATGYNVYVGIAGGQPTKITPVPVQQGTLAAPYIYSGQAGTTYAFSTTAVNNFGESAASNIVSATISSGGGGALDIPGNLQTKCDPLGTSVTLSWSSVTGATSYVFRLDDTRDPYPTIPPDLFVKPYIATSYMTPVIPGVQYKWWVSSQNENTGIASGNSIEMLFVCLAPPTNLQIVFNTPQNNALLPFRQNVPIRLTASTEATRIQFFIDGMLTATNPQNYLNTKWFTRKRGNHILKGIAFDIAGESSPEANIQVKVQ